MTQAALMPHPWKATQHRGFIEKVVLEGQADVAGRTWDAQLRTDPEATGEPITSFTVEVNTIEEPGSIVLYFKLSPEQTALLPRIAHWDIREKYQPSDATDPVSLLYGTIETAKSVTRDAA